MIGDIVARLKRMQGFNVLHPFGWDAFGLPAENAAIKNKLHPETWTLANIAHMKGQLQRLGISYAWGREIATCLPDYYRWNQWLFLRMLEKGIAYRRRSSVNWCPSCLTVLANEQVVDGACWRCGTPVTTRDLEQWFLRITQYADELLDATAGLSAWPEKVLTMQQNWIGRSTGVQAVFPLVDAGGRDARPRDLHDPHRHDLRRDVRAAGARAPARRRLPAPARSHGRSVRRSAASAPRIAWRAWPARSRRKASTPGASRSTRSPASASRSGWPTSCSPTTARARSWRCRSAISATSSSRRSTACRSAPWSRPRTARPSMPPPSIRRR